MSIDYAFEGHPQRLGNYDYSQPYPWGDTRLQVARGYGPPTDPQYSAQSTDPDTGKKTDVVIPKNYFPWPMYNGQFYLDQTDNKLYYAGMPTAGAIGAGTINGSGVGKDVYPYEVKPEALYTWNTGSNLVFQVRSKAQEIMGFYYDIPTYNNNFGSLNLTCTFLGGTWDSTSGPYYKFTHDNYNLVGTYPGTGATCESRFRLGVWSGVYDTNKHLQPGVWKTVTIARKAAETRAFTIPLHRQWQPFIETRWVPGSAQEATYGSNIAPAMILTEGVADPNDGFVTALRPQSRFGWWEVGTTNGFRNVP